MDLFLLHIYFSNFILLMFEVNGEDVTPSKEINMFVFGFYRRFPPYSLPTLGSAAFIALEDIHQNDSILQDYRIKMQIVNDGCSNKTVLDPMVKVIMVHHADIIIGKFHFRYPIKAKTRGYGGIKLWGR